MSSKNRTLFSLFHGVLAIALLLPVPAAAAPTVGQPAPAFSLPGSDGATHSLEEYRGKYVVLEWLNHGCPYVKKHYNTDNMQNLQKEMTGKDVVWLSIISSAPGKQGYSTPEEAQAEAKERSAHPTAILLDPDGKVGTLYEAKTTPHMFVIGPDGSLLYKGAIDDKPSFWKSSVAGAKNYVRQALNESMEGKPVSEPVTTPYGCSVKY